MEKTLICYNKCCGKSFDPKDNTPESCLHHPGDPEFHDTFKKWSCCSKKTVDFTEFLNIQGCTKSYHCNIKPAEKNNENGKKIKKQKVCEYQPLQKKEITQRPDENLPMTKLKFVVGSSLKPMLEKLKDTIKKVENNDKSDVEIGTACKNFGCREVYKGEEGGKQTCIYHSGPPVFHEGLKYWACCGVKRHTDFDNFLEQHGCSKGSHVWHNPKSKMTCRYDWHQTDNSVVISVYCKCSMPDQSSIEANATKLKIAIVFGPEQTVFSKEIPLFRIIDVKESSVLYQGSKVEITLKKGEPESWQKLQFENEKLGDINPEIDDNINSTEKK